MENKLDYNGQEYVENAICCHCGKTHFWHEQVCEVYRGKFLCEDCYNKYYGFCNNCGELNKYIDMNENIVCKGCELNETL